MMAYDNQFVICVMHNGRVLRESNSGVVHIPFDAEYKVRLKNKYAFLRAKARVSIDGRPASNLGDFILQPKETLDLERFLDHSMTEGSRFKFVPLSDGRVADPTDQENGSIKVEFYREVKFKLPDPMPPIRPWKGSGPATPPFTWTYQDSNSPTFKGSSGGGGSSSNVNIEVEEYTSGNIASNCFYSHSVTPVAGEAGATIEGGHSGQAFVYGDTFDTEACPVTLTLQLRGLERSKWEYDVSGHPRPRKRKIKFCPGCGAHRINLEKFCRECGTAFHPRYERERGKLVR
jgi:hypothetical protein